MGRVVFLRRSRAVLMLLAAAANTAVSYESGSGTTQSYSLQGYAGPDWNLQSRALRAHLFATYDRLSPPPNMIKHFYNPATGETSWDPAVLMGPQQTGFGAAPLWRDARPADPTLRYG